MDTEESRDDCIHKYIQPQKTCEKDVGGCILLLLSVANLKNKEHIGCLVTFWFNTFVITYSTTISLV